MEHKIKIGNYTLAELAEEIGNLRYDALGELLFLISCKLGQDSIADQSKGRKLLAKKLIDASSSLFLSSNSIGEAWDISKKHMVIDE